MCLIAGWLWCITIPPQIGDDERDMWVKEGRNFMKNHMGLRLAMKQQNRQAFAATPDRKITNRCGDAKRFVPVIELSHNNPHHVMA